MLLGCVIDMKITRLFLLEVHFKPVLMCRARRGLSGLMICAGYSARIFCIMTHNALGNVLDLAQPSI